MNTNKYTPKKILIIRQGAFPEETRLRKEAEVLRSNNWNVTIICAKHSNEKFRQKWRGIHIYHIPFRHTRISLSKTLAEYIVFSILSFFLTTILFIIKRFDIIQVNNLPDFLLFATVIPKIFKTPIIFDMQELMPEMYLSIAKGKLNKFIFNIIEMIEKLCTIFSTHVITVNDSTKNLLLKRGVPLEKITIVHNVPDESYMNKIATVPNVIDTNNGLNLFTHSTIIKRYGLHTLIKSIFILKDKIPGLQVYIAGMGEYLDDLKKLAISLSVDKYITFLGWIPFEHVLQCVHLSDICLATLENDIYNDLMLPIKIFEYSAFKKPIISSRLYTINKFYGDDSLLYFEAGSEESLADKIYYLHKKPGIRKRLGENAFQKYVKVRWEYHKKVYCDLIEEFANRV